MKFKLDENFDVRVAKLLANEGHDATTILEEQLSGSADEEVFRVAVREGRTLITLDLDFSNPLRFPTRGTPGIIVVRARRPVLSLIERTLLAALPRLLELGLDGKLFIAEPGRLREYEP